MTRIGRAAKCPPIKAAKKAWAGSAMPPQDKTPPLSSRCSNACTAGVPDTSANNVLAAFSAGICAKHMKTGRYLQARQGNQRRDAAFWHAQWAERASGVCTNGTWRLLWASEA